MNRNIIQTECQKMDMKGKPAEQSYVFPRQAPARTGKPFTEYTAELERAVSYCGTVRQNCMAGTADAADLRSVRAALTDTQNLSKRGPMHALDSGKVVQLFG